MTLLFCLIFFSLIWAYQGASVISACYPDVLNTDDKIAQKCYTDFQYIYPKCQGRYCGRNFANSSIVAATNASFILDECTVCENAHYSDGWVCMRCTTTFSFYGLYFIIWLMVYTGLNAFLSIRGQYQSWTYVMRLPFYIISASETIVSALIAFLVNGTLLQFTNSWCPVQDSVIRSVLANGLDDWYPIFFNPPGQECSSERAFPYYSIVFTFYGLESLFLLLRFFLIMAFCRSRAKVFNPVIYSLYGVLVRVVLFFFFGGLLFYAYPYVAIVLHGTAIISMLFDDDKNIITIGGLLFVRWSLVSLCIFAIFQYFWPAGWFMIFPCLMIGMIAPIIFLVVKILCVVVDVKPKTLEFFGFLATLLSPADEDDAPPQPFLAAGDPALGADARPFHRRAVRENEDDIGDGPRERIVPVGVPESVRVPSSEEQHDESIDGVKED